METETTSTSSSEPNPSSVASGFFTETFRAFRYRNFAVLWGGACASSVGTWMQKVAQSWLVYQLSNDAFLLGLDAFLGEIPIFLFTLLGGVVADRSDRRKVLISSQVVQMSSAATLAILYATGMLQIWHILSLSVVNGLAQAFGGPAYQAIVPALVRKEDLSNAIALNSIQFNLARVIGPLIGGFMLVNFGAAWCFGLNATSFLVVIGALLVVSIPAGKVAPNLSIMDSVRNGLGFIRTREGLMPLIVLSFSMTVFGMSFIVFLPAFAKEVLLGGEKEFTFLMATSGCGSILGALMVAALARTGRDLRMMLGGLVVLGIALSLFAISSMFAWAAIFIFIASAALMAVFTLVTSLVQLRTPNEMRGRVMSVYNIAFRGGMPIGSLLMGEAIGHAGVSPVLAVAGLALVALGITYISMRRMFHLGDAEAA
ncbi:MAG: MFS transporter [Bryobacterales bacterium]|nr:MFS transporter [Bryobacterales bacterium]